MELRALRENDDEVSHGGGQYFPIRLRAKS